MKKNILHFNCILFIIMIFSSCSITRENKKLIKNEKIMWEIVSDNDFSVDKIVRKIDSIYAKTFDSKVKYKITKVDCCYKAGKMVIIRTFAMRKDENIVFYFDDKLQIIDIVHELPPLYSK